MATTIDVAVCKCRKICLTGNRWNRSLYTGPKKNKISAPSQTVSTARIAPKIRQGQPAPKTWLTIFKISSKSVHFRTREGRFFGP